MTPLLGFSPDLDSTTKGVIVDCQNLIPTLKGMRSGYSETDAGLSAVPAAVKGAAVMKRLDSTTRLLAATKTTLQEAGATSWSDVSRTVGGAYNGTDETVWRFAQYGDVSLAAQIGDPIQFSITTGAFEDISGAPRAAIIETVGDFVMALKYNDGTETLDGWYCCAIGDYTDWTPAVATQCANGRLTSTPGDIRAGKRLGELIVAYKERAIYIGIYTGPPVIWEWREISNAVGTPCQEVVIPIVTNDGGQAHIFLGYDDFYYFDGSRPVPIGSPLKEWFFNRINRQYMHLCKGLHDPFNKRIYWYYPTTGSALDSCVVYNYSSNKWGTDDRTIEACVDYISAGETYASFEAEYATYDGVPSVAYGSPFWTSSTPVAAVFNTSHTVLTLTGASGTSSMTVGDIGDDRFFHSISRVQPRYITAPTTATLSNYYRNNLSDSLTLDASTSISSGRFDVLRSARWHRLKIDTTGTMEVTAIDVQSVQEGDE